LTLIISDNKTLRESYHSLGQGDIVLGRVNLKSSEEGLLTDLLSRDVHLIPSALSQIASRSKVLQAEIFTPWLPPRTLAIHDNHQLLEALAQFQQIEKVITKQDRKNAGMGIHLWSSVEDVYTHATLGNLPYPFVLQPFYAAAKDIRVILLGDYVEAYWRVNTANFRNNLHCGGKSIPCALAEKQEAICRAVMARGMFPYAHVDLMVTETLDTFLLEINLRGGIRGAKLQAEEYSKRVKAVHQTLLKTVRP
jgi:ribosomal protein S6--L-glutamate ligase